MKIVRRIAKNTIIIFLGKIVIELIGLGIIMILARYLGVSNFGTYSFVFTYLEFFTTIADLGMTIILVREIAQDKAQAGRLLGNAIFLKFILSLLAMGLACIIVTFLPYSFNVKLLVYVGSWILILSLRTLYGVIFQVELNMGYPVLVSITKEISRLILFIFLIFLKATLVWFIIAGIIATFFELLLLFYLSKRFVHISFQIDYKLIKYILNESWPLALVSGLVMIYYRIDQLMLFQMKGPEAVGYYSAATRIPETLVILPSAFMTSVFPLMAKYFKDARESLVKAYTLSFKYMFMFIIPIAIGITLLSKSIICLFYGDRFLPAAKVLAILSWAEIFVYYGLIHYEIIIATGKQKLYIIFPIVGAVSNVILNLFLIPPYGIIGAAVATLISYILSAGPIIGHILPFSRSYNITGCKAMLRPLLASLVMGIYIYFTKSYLWLAVVGGAILFILTLFLIKGIDQEDLKLIRSIIR